MLGWQLLLAGLGTASFVVYARSWKDVAHLVYDIPASFAVFAFVAQLVLEACRGGFNGYWHARLLMLVVISAATVGREFLAWPVSGHLACVLAVALVQMFDARLPPVERVLYVIPLPIVLGMRWYRLDGDDHWQTYYALIVGACAALPAVLAGRWA